MWLCMCCTVFLVCDFVWVSSCVWLSQSLTIFLTLSVCLQMYDCQSVTFYAFYVTVYVTIWVCVCMCVTVCQCVTTYVCLCVIMCMYVVYFSLCIFLFHPNHLIFLNLWVMASLKSYTNTHMHTWKKYIPNFNRIKQWARSSITMCFSVHMICDCCYVHSLGLGWITVLPLCLSGGQSDCIFMLPFCGLIFRAV